MRTRKEYEDIASKTLMTAGEAQGARLTLDVLLDIRDLLYKMEEREQLKEIIAAREQATLTRITQII